MFEGVFVFQPSPWEDRNWARLSGLPLEEVWLPVDESVTIFGWFVDAGPTRPVLLWCHGNAGNISHRLDNLRELFRRGLSVFVFDYRGYGRSTGTPSEPGLYQDALAGYDYVVNQRGIASSRIVVFGRSLGACVAGEVAILRSSVGVILEGAFPSIQAMSDQHYLGLPAHWFLNVDFNLSGRVAKIRSPLLVIHGEKDSIVPVALGWQVYKAANEPKQWFVVVGAEHNDVPFVGGASYFQKITDFVQTLFSKGHGGSP
ncbi:MAG: alpha/beta hydrolase [Nitrospirales bacterium]|nr:alpha/beta hydrolase [Nitrospirales bacterium]